MQQPYEPYLQWRDTHTYTHTHANTRKHTHVCVNTALAIGVLKKVATPQHRRVLDFRANSRTRALAGERTLSSKIHSLQDGRLKQITQFEAALSALPTAEDAFAGRLCHTRSACAHRHAARTRKHAHTYAHKFPHTGSGSVGEIVCKV